jgi:hypothetical protein
MDEPSISFRMGYVGMAALAGAITALAFVKWKELSRGEILLTLVAGFSFAVFVTPWVAETFFGVEPTNVRALAAMTYIFGSGSNILLPLLIRSIGRVFTVNGSEPKK